MPVSGVSDTSTVVLSGTSMQVAVTNVYAGTLQVDGTLASSIVTVNPTYSIAATLAGSGDCVWWCHN